MRNPICDGISGKLNAKTDSEVPLWTQLEEFASVVVVEVGSGIVNDFD